MSIVLDGSVGISSIGTLTGVTSISSTTADTAVILQDSSSNSNTCRAWVNFNGTSTVAIRSDFNVTSITDNGTGDYTMNFSVAMPDGNWAGAGVAQLAINSTGRENLFVSLRRENNLSSTTARLSVQSSDTAIVADAALVAFAVFR